MGKLPISATATLSKRGRGLLARSPMPQYLLEHSARAHAPYERELRPHGYIPLCVAENRLVTDLMLERMARRSQAPPRVLGYDAMIGSGPFREALAEFLSLEVLDRPVHPGQVAVLAGAGSVLEILFYALGDPGDGVLVPTPSYAGFWMDLQLRDELQIVPVHRRSEDGFRLTPDLLDHAVAAAGRPVKALLYTSPDNPLGRVVPREEIEAVLRWAEGAGVHLVLDEVYALSVFGERSFVSGAALRADLGDRVHVVWAFSKDFGASGLRCGVLVTENRDLLEAVDALAYWACCSGDTQHLLAEMVADHEWVEGYLAAMRDRLRVAYGAVVAALERADVPSLPADAGVFLLLDLRRYLEEPTQRAEHELWRCILDEANVNLTPGGACRIAEPGFMRLCYAGVPVPTAVEGVRRVAAVLSGRA